MTEQITQAKNGSELAKLDLINRYKPYILNVAGHICKRYITWSDEESSIGLLAFNKALDTYMPGNGKTFLNYAFLLIQRDLFNYLKQHKRALSSISLNSTSEEDQSAISSMEYKQSMKVYQEKADIHSLADEILELNACLNEFHIHFKDLQDSSPKHSDSREQLNEMARKFIQYKDLTEELCKKKRFPATTFIERTGYRLKTIEKYRKYLITIVYIHLHPEWTHLASFIKVERRIG